MEIMNNFRNCTGVHKKQYMQKLEVEDALTTKNAAACELVVNLVETCGNLWELCHTMEEVESIKEKQIEDLISKNKDISLDIVSCLEVHRSRYELLLGMRLQQSNQISKVYCCNPFYGYNEDQEPEKVRKFHMISAVDVAID